MHPALPERAVSPGRVGLRRWLGTPALVWWGVWLSFAAFATCRSPIPGVNEPHYLCKARHFWDPGWCARDLFLGSAPAHVVFYCVFGPWTTWWPLAVVAAVGRGLAWALLATGWCRMFGAWCPASPAAALFGAWLFLGCQALGSLSGEWVIGGLESKVFAYACLWLALAEVGRQRWERAWFLLGLAVSWHPVVGIWACAAALGATVWTALAHRIRSAAQDGRNAGRPGVRVGIRCAAWAALAAGPGLVPAWWLLREADPAVARTANYIQVYYRLAHHLDPAHFSTVAVGVYVAAVLGWGVFRCWRPGNAAQCWADRLVWGSVLIAVAGWTVRWAPDTSPALRTWLNAREPALPDAWRFAVASLLKFYPFRLADVCVPLACVAALLRGVLPPSPVPDAAAVALPRTVGRRMDVRTWSVGLASAGVGLMSLLWPAPDAHPGRMSPAQWADWQRLCAWVRTHTPADALFLTTPETWGFKWFAERAEFVHYKDCPQDARALLEWNERLQRISRWTQAHVAEGYTPDELHELRRREGIDYLVTAKLGPIHIEPAFQVGRFRVYRLP